MPKDFLILQLAVGFFVAYVVLKTAPLKDALVGDATNIPEWVNLKNPGIKFI